MSIKIKFDSITKLYWPGQKLMGHVDVDYGEPKPVMKIAIHFKGFTCVKWAKKKRNSATEKPPEYRHYRSEIIHFMHKDILMGKDNKKCVLSPGLKSYPFSFTLPNNLPSSLDGKYGYTKYSVKAKVFTRPWTSDNSLEEAITIMALVNLNEVTNANIPLAAAGEKVLGIHKPGLLCAVVKAPASGFVAGQIIPFTIDAVNKSDAEISSINLQVIRREHFVALEPYKETKTAEKIMKDVQFGAMDPWEERSIVATFQFPLLIPSGLNVCEIVDVDYIIKVVFKVPCCSKDLRILQPIVIGTVPLCKGDASECEPLVSRYSMAGKFK